MPTLTQHQIDRFWAHGFIVAERGVNTQQLGALNRQLRVWVEESHRHTENFGSTVDGKARFDLEAEHSAHRPMLRRVNNPVEVSDDYRDIMLNARYVDMIADLIGPDVKFHHCKINVKMPGSQHEVRWHQDHPFDPHTNDDEVWWHCCCSPT